MYSAINRIWKENTSYGIAVFCVLVIGSIVFYITKPPPLDAQLIFVRNAPSGHSDTLVVLLHAYKNKAESLNGVKNTLMSQPAFQNADFLVPELPFSTFSMANPNKVAHEIMLEIDKAWKKQKYEKIVFVGHSMGALFARKLYVLAAGENEGALFDKAFHKLAQDTEWKYTKTRPWASKIERIILLAGMNNGWSISHHMGIQNIIAMNIGTMLGHILETVHDTIPIIFHIRNGSGFITQLRLQWIAMKESVEKKEKTVGDVLTVQLLGTVDDLVPPTDNIDLVTGDDFQYIEVPYSGHASIIQMDYAASKDDPKYARASKLIDASIIGRRSEIRVDPKEVLDVAFVVHGIRDFGYWTEKIANRIKLKAKEEGKYFESIHSTYGYFPMLSFLRPGARDEKVQWFMNNYTVAKAKYPNATFHFVGHSHGTYLLARALEKYDSVSFGNVVFAGSVVREKYDWKTIYDQKRVDKITNFTASNDWVVAWFPHALEILNVQDLGSAGHNGFYQEKEFPDIVKNVSHVIGGHSAAIQEPIWDSIASFIVDDDFQKLQQSLITTNFNFLVKYTAPVAPLVWIILFLIISYGFYKLSKMQTREWRKTLYILSYMLVLWTVLTRI